MNIGDVVGIDSGKYNAFKGVVKGVSLTSGVYTVWVPKANVDIALSEQEMTLLAKGDNLVKCGVCSNTLFVQEASGKFTCTSCRGDSPLPNQLVEGCSCGAVAYRLYGLDEAEPKTAVDLGALALCMNCYQVHLMA